MPPSSTHDVDSFCDSHNGAEAELALLFAIIAGRLIQVDYVGGNFQNRR
jgi:hypothetical protein